MLEGRTPCSICTSVPVEPPERPLDRRFPRTTDRPSIRGLDHLVIGFVIRSQGCVPAGDEGFPLRSRVCVVAIPPSYLCPCLTSWFRSDWTQAGGRRRGHRPADSFDERFARPDDDAEVRARDRQGDLERLAIHNVVSGYGDGNPLRAAPRSGRPAAQSSAGSLSGRRSRRRAARQRQELGQPCRQRGPSASSSRDLRLRMQAKSRGVSVDAWGLDGGPHGLSAYSCCRRWSW